MKKIVIGNLKTYMDFDDTNNYINDMKKYRNKFIVCPTSIYVPFFIENKYIVGLQDVSSNENGVRTGDVLSSQAISMNINYSIVGHSERRKIETTIDINKKIISNNKYNITSILCVGEESETTNSKEVIKKYLLSCLKNTSVDKVIIAYEPIWAIGTSVTPSNKQIYNTIKYIKELIKKEYKCDVKVLYGGSVSKDNIKKLNSIGNVDGFLVGGSSTISSEFKEIIDWLND